MSIEIEELKTILEASRSDRNNTMLHTRRSSFDHESEFAVAEDSATDGGGQESLQMLVALLAQTARSTRMTRRVRMTRREDRVTRSVSQERRSQ